MPKTKQKPKASHTLIALGKNYSKLMKDHGFSEEIKSDRYRVFQRKKAEIWGDDRTCIFATNDRYELKVWLDTAGLDIVHGSWDNDGLRDDNGLWGDRYRFSACWTADIAEKAVD